MSNKCTECKYHWYASNPSLQCPIKARNEQIKDDHKCACVGGHIRQIVQYEPRYIDLFGDDLEE